MAQTTLLVEFDIKPGKTEAFKAATKAIFAKTQEEPGTLRYEYFLSDDGTSNMNIEVFEDADAFVYHNRNMADVVPALFETTPTTTSGPSWPRSRPSTTTASAASPARTVNVVAMPAADTTGREAPAARVAALFVPAIGPRP